MKQLFYDLETTGTKYWRNSIHQLSGMVVVDGEVKRSLISMCSRTPRPTLRRRHYKLQE